MSKKNFKKYKNKRIKRAKMSKKNFKKYKNKRIKKRIK